MLTVVSLGTRVMLAYIFSNFFGVEDIWWSIPVGWLLADIADMIKYKAEKYSKA